jgi:copper(I)-binding protein
MSGRAPRVLLLAGGLVLAVLAALLYWADTGSSAAPHLRVVGAYVPQPASPDVAAAYFTVVNSGSAADALIGVTSDVSSDAMLHRNTAMTMEMVSSATIPAHGRLTLSPGGYHVMLEHPTRSLVSGDHITLTLKFRAGPAITFQVPVEPIGYQPGSRT